MNISNTKYNYTESNTIKWNSLFDPYIYTHTHTYIIFLTEIHPVEYILY